jgi:UDP-2,4-diacetamido-2,4,6-trideoxy-beta-L-altropyranose hydrolase
VSDAATIVCRADASVTLGMGHVMRCLALADALRRRGGVVRFVCREHEGHLCNLIEKWGFAVNRMGAPASTAAGDAVSRPDGRLGATWREDAEQTRVAIGSSVTKPEWLIVDHYAIDDQWESRLRPSVARILVIDDLADRRHDCDVLLDQNYYDNMEHRYQRLVPRDCIKALGPTFALLRQEFYEARKSLRPRGGQVERILVAFGGADPTNETGKVLEALASSSFRDLQIDVVVGTMNRYKAALFGRYAVDPRVRFHESTANISALMTTADLSVGAGGTMTWERCYLGLPSIVLVIADNQAETSAALHRAGVILNLGQAAEVSCARVAAAVETLASDPDAVTRMSRESMALMVPDEAVSPEMRILKTLVREQP